MWLLHRKNAVPEWSQVTEYSPASGPSRSVIRSHALDIKRINGSGYSGIETPPEGVWVRYTVESGLLAKSCEHMRGKRCDF